MDSRKSTKLIPLNSILYENFVRRALREDFGRAGDVTTASIIPVDATGEGKIVSRVAGCLAGVELAATAFRLLDPEVSIDIAIRDGSETTAGDVIATVRGSARTLLEGERTALNILGHLSGIAAVTHRIVRSIEGSPTRIVCTRKTTPGLRVLEKYAVRAGGGFNHRFGLDDAVLIKENHLAIAGGITEAVRRARAAVGHMVKVEVEVETLTQLEEAIQQEVDAVLLDNMSLQEIREAVKLVSGRVITEVSGGVTPERVPEIAATGVDLISLGWLTHSAPNLDVAFDVRGEC